MNSRSGFLVVSFLVLLGSSIIQTKRGVSRFGKQCIDFADEKSKYHLPSDVLLSWDELNELTPCCVKDGVIPGCRTCNENLVWKFNTKDYGPTMCITVPFSRTLAKDFKNLHNTRRLIGDGGSGPSIRSRDPNYMSSGSTESSGGKPWEKKLTRRYLGKDEGLYEYGTSQGLRTENSPARISQELLPPLQKPEPEQPHLRMFSSGERPVDSGFFKNMLSQLLSSSQSVPSPVLTNTTNANIDKNNQQSVVPVNCTFPVQEINPVASDWYSGREPPGLPTQTRGDQNFGVDSYVPWDVDNTRHPEVPVPNSNVRNFASSTGEKQPNGIANMNMNIDRISNRRNREQPQHMNKAGQEYGGNSLPLGYNSQSKKIRRKRDTVKQELN